ncbi:hypothetical protein [Kitasatospora sp. NPDC101183]|uniref:hypothetical protein n=1 Tax=Kitasatospora sp. NPDC101183 TaxID=3364100 RepID=UPI00380EFECF
MIAFLLVVAAEFLGSLAASAARTLVTWTVKMIRNKRSSGGPPDTGGDDEVEAGPGDPRQLPADGVPPLVMGGPSQVTPSASVPPVEVCRVQWTRLRRRQV